jgi:hypothetical protein
MKIPSFLLINNKLIDNNNIEYKYFIEEKNILHESSSDEIKLFIDFVKENNKNITHEYNKFKNDIDARVDYYYKCQRIFTIFFTETYGYTLSFVNLKKVKLV